MTGGQAVSVVYRDLRVGVQQSVVAADLVTDEGAGPVIQVTGRAALEMRSQPRIVAEVVFSGAQGPAGPPGPQVQWDLTDW